jgi:hypothetical protein
MVDYLIEKRREERWRVEDRSAHQSDIDERRSVRRCFEVDEDYRSMSVSITVRLRLVVEAVTAERAEACLAAGLAETGVLAHGSLNEH